MAVILSKSNYMYGVQCPKRLFLQKFKRSLANVTDAQTTAIFAAGNEIGVLAQSCFPGGYNAQQQDPYPWEDSALRTAYMLKKTDVIYEATFIHEGVLCAVDILVKTPEGYDVYEVKGSNSVKMQHVKDASLQYFVLKGAGIPIRSFHIMHLNRDYVRRGNLVPNELFCSSDITEDCLKLQDEVKNNLDVFVNLLRSKQEPEVPMGPHCAQPYACNFSEYCQSLPINRISPPTEMALSNEITYHREELDGFLSELVYPIYFLDFETYMQGIPPFDESRPYQQLPFQFSLHVLHELHGTLGHHEFLADGHLDPRMALLQSLKESLGDKGSILVWNKSFENGRLVELARDFPEYSELIDSYLDRIVDLMVPFRKGWVYSEAFYGSASIKNVLPVMIPDLNYGHLNIQAGDVASLTYSMLHAMEGEELKQVRQDLLDYCRLDTLGMVEIFRAIHLPARLG